MKVLVIGSGGREHALCWKLRQSPELEELYCAPGNPGIAQIADQVRIPADEVHELGQFAAELEGSKVFAKEFMKRHDIPTARFEIAHDLEGAREAARSFGFPVVLKADGLAAGKGVLIVQNETDLEQALHVFFEEKRFGTSGQRVVVEEFLVGEEVSFISICDGERVIPLATSKDYKRLQDGDLGPNTGGMGAHSPAGIMPSGLGSEILDKIVRPTVSGMADENRRFVGFLYTGLILTDNGPRVLEYNVRLGDPEAQVLLMRLEDDLLPVLARGAAGRFEKGRLHFRKEAAACVVMSSAGYPDKPVKGDPIDGLDQAALIEGAEVFHAGTAQRDGRIVTAGGRVLNVCASGPNLRDALKLAYQAAAKIHWPNRYMRCDIGRRVLEGAG